MTSRPSNSPTLSDASLAQRLASSEGFTEAFRQCGSQVYRYAYSRVGPDLAEDVVADTFADAWRSAARFKGSTEHELRAWLLGVATNVISQSRRDEVRWIRSRGLYEASTFNPSTDEAQRAVERLTASSNLEHLSEALAALPPRERDVLLLHALQGLSYEELARALAIPIGTVRSRISRARKRIDKTIKAMGVNHA